MSLENEIKTLIISSLELEDITTDDIKDDEPLFGSGLGLDSIDALELGMALKKKYHIDLGEDKEENKKHFYSVKTIADFIKNNKDLINAGIDLVAPKLGVKGNIARGVVNAISNGPSLRELQLLNSNMNSSDDEVYHETGGMIKPIYK